MTSVMESFGEWAHQHDPRHPQTDTSLQETPMSRITDARNHLAQAEQQLAAIAANPLAEAIAEAGLGASFGPQDVALVLAMLRAIQHGPGQAATQDEQAQQSAPAA